MRFCRECGTELTAESTFCKVCGTRVVRESTFDSTPYKTQQNIHPSKVRKPMSKKSKIVWASIILAFILLFATHKLVKMLLSKERLIENFEAALLEKDAKKLALYLSSNDSDLRINEESVSVLIDYFDRHPEQIDEVISFLKLESELLNEVEEGSINPQDLEDFDFLDYFDYLLDDSFIFLQYCKFPYYIL